MPRQNETELNPWSIILHDGSTKLSLDACDHGMAKYQQVGVARKITLKHNHAY